MKQKLLLLAFTIMPLYLCAQLRVSVGRFNYDLTGYTASVVGLSNRIDSVANIPGSIKYNGLEYSVTSISANAFKDNSFLAKVVLPNTITTIGSSAFYGCKNLTSISMPNVETIGSSAFYGCVSLISIIIPSSTKEMGTDVFKNCPLLRDVIYLGNNAPKNWIATSHTYKMDWERESSTTPYKIGTPTIMDLITFNDNSFTYTGKAPTPTYTCNIPGYDVSIDMTLQTEAGNYSTYFSATFTKDTTTLTAEGIYRYTIERAPLTGKLHDISKTYGEAAPASYYVTYSGYVDGESSRVSSIPSNNIIITNLYSKPVTIDEKSYVGTYQISVDENTITHQNYDVTYEPATLTIKKSSLFISVTDTTKIYGSENPAFKINYSGLKNNESAPEYITKPTFTTKAEKNSEVGTYDVSVNCAPRNYEIVSNKPGLLTITQAPLTIKANNTTMEYGGNLPSYTFTYDGFVNDDNNNVLTAQPSIQETISALSNAGTYVITPTGAVAKNYNIEYAPGTLIINPRTLTVKADSQTRLYGDENPTLTYMYKGFINNENESVITEKPIVSTSATTKSAVGTYDITINGGKAKNYKFLYESGTLNVTPRPLTASVNNYERCYGQENPVFEVIYDGLIGNDTGSSLTIQPICRTNATKTSDVGSYDITVTGGYSPNYTFSYGSGKLTVVKAEQAFEWEQDLKKLEVGQQIELKATASSGLPVTYTADDKSLAEIYKVGNRTYMECKAPGSFSIKAVQDGNNNYYSTQRISKDVTIVEKGSNEPLLTIRQAESGTVSLQVDRGNRYTFSIHAEAGWKVHSLSFNNEDVTQQINDNGKYTTPVINEDATLNAVFEKNVENGILASTRKSSARIQATTFGVKVTNVEPGNSVQIFTEDGILQKSVKIESSQTDINLPKDKLYIIKVDNKTYKMRL